MFEWHQNVQRMIDWIEENITDSLLLGRISELLNYSPFYCTKQFHAITGMSLRNYIRLRKVCNAALELRDTDGRILDIAVKYGFSSQEAFSRAFVKAYGVAPSAYRKVPKPIPLLLKRYVFNPYILEIGERCKLSKEGLKEITVRFEVLPAHKFIGIRNINARHYFHLWKLQEQIPGQDCHTVCGLLESISGSINGQVGGWYIENGHRGYLYGIEVATGHCGEVPEQMQCIEVPESLYVVFYHPPYNYEDINDTVMGKVDEMAWTWDPEEHGYMWNEEENPIYQRSEPEKYGYAICRPVKRINP